jgi:hypothetical protein
MVYSCRRGRKSRLSFSLGYKHLISLNFYTYGEENHNMSLTLAGVLTSSEEELSEILPVVQNQVAVEKNRTTPRWLENNRIRRNGFCSIGETPKRW